MRIDKSRTYIILTQFDIYSKIAAERKINIRNLFSNIILLSEISSFEFSSVNITRNFDARIRSKKKKSETLIKFHYWRREDRKKKKKQRQPAHRRSRIKHLRAADHSDRCWLCFRGLHPLDNRDYPPWQRAADRVSLL